MAKDLNYIIDIHKSTQIQSCKNSVLDLVFVWIDSLLKCVWVSNGCLSLINFYHYVFKYFKSQLRANNSNWNASIWKLDLIIKFLIITNLLLNKKLNLFPLLIPHSNRHAILRYDFFLNWNVNIKWRTPAINSHSESTIWSNRAICMMIVEVIIVCGR